MEFWESVALAVLGAALTLTTQLVIRAVRQRGRMSGARRSMLDIAHSSRLIWMVEAARLRGICLKHGVTSEMIGPAPPDPWEEFAMKQALGSIDKD